MALLSSYLVGEACILFQRCGFGQWVHGILFLFQSTCEKRYAKITVETSYIQIRFAIACFGPFVHLCHATVCLCASSKLFNRLQNFQHEKCEMSPCKERTTIVCMQVWNVQAEYDKLNYIWHKWNPIDPNRKTAANLTLEADEGSEWGLLGLCQDPQRT